MRPATAVRAVAGLALSALFLWLVLRGVDLRLAFGELRGANAAFVVPAAVVLMTGIWLRAVRWQIILRPLGKVRISHSFSALTIGYMANNALPARLGELVRVYVLNRDSRLPSAAILGSIVLERILDVITLLLLLALAAALSGWNSPWTGPLVGLGAAAALALAVVYMWAAGLLERLVPVAASLRPFAGLFGGLPARMLGSFATGLKMASSPRALGLTLAVSAISWTVEACLYFLVMLAMGIGQEGFWLAVLVACVTNLAGVIPAGPGNLGTFEFFAKQTAVLFGVPEEKALAFALAAHVMVLAPPTIIGFALAWQRGFSNLRA